jgi:hypothetical protein
MGPSLGAKSQDTGQFSLCAVMLLQAALDAISWAPVLQNSVILVSVTNYMQRIFCVPNS